MSLYLLLGFMAAVFTFLASPGPVTLLVINNGAKGFAAGLFTIFGTNVASLVLILVSYLVIQSVFGINEAYLSLLQIAGSLYLLYFAFSMLSQAIRAGTTESAQTPTSRAQVTTGVISIKGL